MINVDAVSYSTWNQCRSFQPVTEIVLHTISAVASVAASSLKSGSNNIESMVRDLAPSKDNVDRADGAVLCVQQLSNLPKGQRSTRVFSSAVLLLLWRRLAREPFLHHQSPMV